MSLEQLLGTWDLEMDHGAVAAVVRGRQVYERVLDDAFVRLGWTYEHPDFPDALALLSETEMHYFDVRGVTRCFAITWHDGGWTMTTSDPEFAQRFTARFDGPDVVVTEGECSEDDGKTWRPDFTTTMRRVG